MAPARGRPAQALAQLLVLVLGASAHAQRSLRKPPIGAPPGASSTPTGCLVDKPPTQGSVAYCERRITDPKQPTNTIFCSRVPNNPWETAAEPGLMAYFPPDRNQRFSVGDYSNSCLFNAAVPCTYDSQALYYSNTLKDDDPDLACCSCFLYTKYCAGKSGITLSYGGGNKFVLDGALSPSGNEPWHSLVMPKAPCSGVDNWNVNPTAFPKNNGHNCPGEEIWNAAQTVIEDAQYNPVLNPASQYFGADNTFGLSINPVSRRGQHQMHVHVAKVWPSIMASLDYQYNVVYALSGKASDLTFYLDCGLASDGKKRRLDKCSIFTGTPDTYKVKVTMSKHAFPASANPFATVYGATAPPVSTAATTYTSTLVVQVPPAAEKTATKVWAVVANSKGPAECYQVSSPHCIDRT